jgi:hypothetical protein
MDTDKLYCGGVLIGSGDSERYVVRLYKKFFSAELQVLYLYSETLKLESGQLS